MDINVIDQIQYFHKHNTSLQNFYFIIGDVWILRYNHQIHWKDEKQFKLLVMNIK